MTTLISMLGKGASNQNYRTAKYQLDSNFTCEVSFLGLALAEYIKPNRLIIAGTAGSMWDVFFDQHDIDEQSLLTLIDAVPNNAVTQDMLKLPEAFLSEKLRIPVTCVLIPYAKTDAEQISILQMLADNIVDATDVVLDVTHGFRHLPMLAIVCARYLQHVKNVNVKELYYGALEMTNNEGITPVLKLGGLLRLLDWTDALAIYNHSGDYSVFGELLQQDGLEPNKADQLTQAAFYERTGNPNQAKASLGNVFRDLENHQGELGKLFMPALIDRINWFRKPTRDQYELALADEYLQRNDFLRSAIYMHESVITAATIKHGVDSNNFDDRKTAAEQEKTETSKKLARLRNTLTHGLRSQDTIIRSLLKTPSKLKEAMQQLRKEL